jgi:hypothetical protein
LSPDSIKVPVVDLVDEDVHAEQTLSFFDEEDAGRILLSFVTF